MVGQRFGGFEAQKVEDVGHPKPQHGFWGFGLGFRVQGLGFRIRIIGLEHDRVRLIPVAKTCPLVPVLHVKKHCHPMLTSKKPA